MIISILGVLFVIFLIFLGIVLRQPEKKQKEASEECKTISTILFCVSAIIIFLFIVESIYNVSRWIVSSTLVIVGIVMFCSNAKKNI